MFLALDESLEGKTTVIGCLCFPMTDFAELESKAMNIRAIQRLWSEMKWNKINDTYGEKYLKYISAYLDNTNVTFHSWAYDDLPLAERVLRHRTADKKMIFYKHCYALIRAVMKKCIAAGVYDFYIVADSTGPLGNEQYKIITDYLKADRRFPVTPNLICCTTGDSATVNALQVADIATGCIAQACYTQRKLNDGKKKIHSYLLKSNQGIELDITPKVPGKLEEAKFHHCNINKYNAIKV